MGVAIKHPMPLPDRVKPSFVIFVRVPGTLTLSSQLCSSECPDVKNYKWRLNPVWQ